jgi:histidinol-phosphate aminotransferase
MLQALTDMGLEVPPSRSNFVFPRIPAGRASEIHKELEQRRILVRYFNAPEAADSLRVTVGTDDEVKAFLHALRALL